MEKTELKQILKPLIKECIKEVIFEDGVLSGLITEVAQGLSRVQTVTAPVIKKSRPRKKSNNQAVLQAQEQLNEVRQQLNESTGIQGVFENIAPISQPRGKNSQHGPLRDLDPGSAGVNIDGLVNMTGGWKHLK